MQSNPFHEPVSMKAKRMRVGLEYFHGESLVCSACERPFRSFREAEVMCSACRSIGEAINDGQA